MTDRPEKWKGLRKVADYLYEIADEGYQDKTAREIQAEICVALKGEFGPLLDAAEKWWPERWR